MRRRAILCLGLLALACDRQSPPHVTPASNPTTVPAAPDDPTSLGVEVLATLAADRDTILALDDAGTPFWLQGGGLMRLDRGVPAATHLTAARVGRDLKLANFRGELVTILGDDRGVWFVAQGRDGRHPVVVLGRYDPETDRVSVVADTDALMNASGMSEAITLAPITLSRVGERPVLFVRHVDRAAILDVAPAGVTTRLDRLLDEAAQPLGPAAVPMAIVSEADRPQLVDDARARLLAVNAAGQIALRYSLPSGGSYPLAVTFRGRPLLLALDRPAGMGRFGPADAAMLPFHAPALMLFRGDGLPTVIDARRWDAPPGLDLDKLAPSSLAGGRDALLLYDRAGGKLLKLTPR
jgi:hypothetical protein